VIKAEHSRLVVVTEKLCIASPFDCSSQSLLRVILIQMVLDKVGPAEGQMVFRFVTTWGPRPGKLYSDPRALTTRSFDPDQGVGIAAQAIFLSKRNWE
jgi:hypothetical protein